MGLIKVGKQLLGAVGGAFDTATSSMMFKEYYASGDMSQGVLMKRGEKIVSGKSQNKGGDDNIITSGSIVDVQENQCLIIVDNGKIVDFTTEPGRYNFDTSTAPSFICGNNKGVKAALTEFGREILVGGQRQSTQRVYFINTGKVWEPLLWGLGNIMFHHTSVIADGMPPIQMNMKLRGHGTIDTHIGNPISFYKEIGAQLAGGDNAGYISMSNLQETVFKSIKTSINSSISSAISKLGRQYVIAYSDIAAHNDEIEMLVNQEVNSDSVGRCGFEFYDFHIDGALEPSEEDYKKLSDMETNLGTSVFYGSNANVANYDIQKTMARGVENAGANGGAQGLFGVGMGMGAIGANNFGNMQFQQTHQTAQTPVVATAQVNGWTCECGATNTANFCAICGAKKPDGNNKKQEKPVISWTCECGTENNGNFCANCGKKKPTVKKYKCDKCGWVPKEGQNVRFCPECGDIFDDSDIIEE